MPDHPEIPVEQLHAHAQFVRAVARGILGGDAEVEDVLQDTFLVAWRRGPDKQGALRSWLGTVAKRLSIDRLRSAKRRSSHEQAAARPEGLPALGDIASHEETRHFVAEAVLALEEPYRSTMLWRYYAGRSAAQIAELQNVPVATVRSRLHRALVRLRERLDARHGGDRRAWGMALAPLTDSKPWPKPTAAVAGGILVKKLAVALAVLLLAVGGYVVATRPSGDDAPRSQVAGGAPDEATVGPGLAGRQCAPALAKYEAPKDARQPRPVPNGPAIRGRVVDGGGRGIARAWVAAFADTVATTIRPEEIDEKSEVGASNYTDADGRFAVAAVGVAPFFDLVAEAEGFSPLLTESVKAGSEVTVTLVPAARLSGRVLTMDGEPIPGAHVSVKALVGVVRFERQVDSAADGRYSVGGLPRMVTPEFHVSAVLVAKDGFAPLYIPGLGHGLATDVERTLDLVLVRGATLTGRVVEDEGGAPVADARVVLFSIESMQSWARSAGRSVMNPWSPRVLAEARSGADGSYRIEHVPANGFHRVQTNNTGRRGMTLGHVGAWKEGWCWATDEVPVVEDGASIETEVRLRPSATLAGRVVDAQGRPIARVLVYCVIDGSSSHSSWMPACVGAVPAAQATTSDDGRYRLEGAPASAKPSRVKVTAQVLAGDDDGGTRPPRTVSMTLDAKAHEVTIVSDIVITGEDEPATGKEISLLVVDPAGAPVWGARIEDANGASWMVASRPRRTGRDGKFLVSVRVGPNEKGPLNAVVRARGYAAYPIALSLPIEPKPGEEIRVALEPGRRVGGRVLTSDGTPAAHASVSVHNGSVLLADLVPPEGTPVGMTPFKARRANDPVLSMFASATTGPDGRFSAEDLPEGPYHILAWPAWGGGPRAVLSRPATLSGVASGTADAELILSPTVKREVGAIVGTVVDGATGKPLGSFEVTLTRRREAGDPPVGPTSFRQADGSSVFFYTSPNASTEKTSVGRFESRDLELGTYDVSVSAPGYVSANVEGVSVRAAQLELPPVSLSRGTRIHGRVKAPEGVSLKDRSLTINSVGTGQRASVTVQVQADGAFDGTGLSPGRHRVVVLTPAGEAVETAPPLLREGDADLIIDGADTLMDLTLVRGGSLLLQLSDKRLPSPSGWSAQATPAQREFGRGSNLTLRAADGRVVLAQGSLENGMRVDLLWSVLLSGSYVAKLECPGGETFEQRVEVSAGASVSVQLGSGAADTTAPPAGFSGRAGKR